MIKLLVPDMPTADDLLPYLRRIDAARVYVNRGPLVQKLEARLEQMTGAPCVTVSNGTVALELALKAACNPTYDDYRYVVAPALTFSATGLAARNVGFGSNLADIDGGTWNLTPKSVEDRLSPLPQYNTERARQQMFRNTAAVMPVATFGDPVYTRQWEGYHVPVVIDAAGAFPSQKVSKDPNIATCFSLHATKFIGCGEGGFVASHNAALIERVRELSMFGEDGTNAKMSEYHAAVALASLDRIEEKTVRMEQISLLYMHHLSHQFPASEYGDIFRVSSTILNVVLPKPVTQDMINKLKDEGVETKQWYRPYLDERAEFAVPRGTFPVTDYLRDHLLGLPFHNFLTEDDVKYVCKKLGEVLK